MAQQKTTLIDQLQGLNAEQLRRLLVEQLTQQKLGLYWESNAIERDAALDADNIHAFDAEAAQVCGRLRVPHPEHELDKQIAAIEWVNDLTVVTRNEADFSGTGVRLKNPFLVV